MHCWKWHQLSSILSKEKKKVQIFIKTGETNQILNNKKVFYAFRRVKHFQSLSTKTSKIDGNVPKSSK